MDVIESSSSSSDDELILLALLADDEEEENARARKRRRIWSRQTLLERPLRGELNVLMEFEKQTDPHAFHAVETRTRLFCKQPTWTCWRVVLAVVVVVVKSCYLLPLQLLPHRASSYL